ncbi:hypothetical protein [Rhizobium sp. L43]|uniref:hypothetical protein n=1 Tax=Rhizobium sp. L43 TaxID=2035452 RepID=UPI000BE92594|nr:hypothetical protein [Rhizobium sp. L43]PDS78932.1 hypothetical protein CO667_11970 [Rhizobium sp. L43]
MSSDILAIAYRERERLQAELNATRQKLQQVQRLISVYEVGDSNNAKPAASSYRQGSKAALVDEIVSKHLAQTRVRASSGELLPIVQDAGVTMTGKIPAKTLSAFLATSKRFNNLKGFGYGLTEWGESPQKPSHDLEE